MMGAHWVLDWTWPGGEFWWRGAWASVVLPLAVVLVWLGPFHRRAPAQRLPVVPTHADSFPALFWVLAVACAGISAASGAWVVTSESVSLHLMPAGFTVVALLLYLRVSLSPGYAYALTFVSLFMADVTRALVAFGPTGSRWWEGLGGAGLADGLFFFPLVSAALVGYARLRAKSGSL